MSSSGAQPNFNSIQHGNLCINDTLGKILYMQMYNHHGYFFVKTPNSDTWLMHDLGVFAPFGHCRYKYYIPAPSTSTRLHIRARHKILTPHAGFVHRPSPSLLSSPTWTLPQPPQSRQHSNPQLPQSCQDSPTTPSRRNFRRPRQYVSIRPTSTRISSPGLNPRLYLALIPTHLSFSFSYHSIPFLLNSIPPKIPHHAPQCPPPALRKGVHVPAEGGIVEYIIRLWNSLGAGPVRIPLEQNATWLSSFDFFLEVLHPRWNYGLWDRSVSPGLLSRRL